VKVVNNKQCMNRYILWKSTNKLKNNNYTL